MKTIITTLVIAVFLSIGNSFGKNNSQLYKNIIENTEERTVTTTVCKGKNEMYLVPLTQHVLKYNVDGKPEERVSYNWESHKKIWVAVQKYTYEYYADGELATISYAEWDGSIKSWGDDIQYATYIYDSEDNLSSIVQNNKIKNLDLGLK